MSSPLAGQPIAVYSVNRLNSEVRECLESAFGLIWLEGEVSNLVRPSSGHLYFSVKDQQAQVRCAMFRGRNRSLSFTPANGQQLLMLGRVSLYEVRGEYQFIVERMEEIGSGELQRKFDALKARLFAEGLFDEALKRPLPELPKRIGVITSPTGAALRDVLTVLNRRFPSVPILIYPTRVQGAGAGDEIAATIELASRRRDCDVLLLVRGGGSLEDLWAFNDESVAHALVACGIPVVSGVGHEIDLTIADLAADRRAPTPSAAAELASPDGQELEAQLGARLGRLTELFRDQLQRRHDRLQALSKRLQQLHPERRIRQHIQRRDELEIRLQRSMLAQLSLARTRASEQRRALLRTSPQARLGELRIRYEQMRDRLAKAEQNRLERAKLELAAVGRALQAVSPLSTLGRGYAILRPLPLGRSSLGPPITDARQVSVGDDLEAQLAHGRLTCKVLARTANLDD